MGRLRLAENKFRPLDAAKSAARLMDEPIRWQPIESVTAQQVSAGYLANDKDRVFARLPHFTASHRGATVNHLRRVPHHKKRAGYPVHIG